MMGDEATVTSGASVMNGAMMMSGAMTTTSDAMMMSYDILSSIDAGISAMKNEPWKASLPFKGYPCSQSEPMPPHGLLLEERDLPSSYGSIRVVEQELYIIQNYSEFKLYIHNTKL
jgi:hypothetical protein